MSSVVEAHAERRVLVSAGLLGSGIGLALGAIFMVAGLSEGPLEHARAVRAAQAAADAPSQVVAAHQGAEIPLVAANLRGAQAPGAASDAPRQATRDLDCLTDAVYFEARGEDRRGQQAVATVVMNRVKNPNFPKSVCGVVFQRARGACQFSFACDGSMRRGRDEDAWEQARRVASRTLSGYVLRDIGSATHFHSVGVSPDWGAQMLKVAQVGLHVFYRRNPHAPVERLDAPEPEEAVFVAATDQTQPSLRIATALVQKTPETAAPAVSAKPAPPEPAAVKPAAKLPETPPEGLSKAAAPETPAPAVTTAS